MTRDAEIMDSSFIDALRIHAICVDLSLSSADAKLYTFIHVKAKLSEDGTDYFLKEQIADICALRLLLSQLETRRMLVEMNTLHKELGDAFEKLVAPDKIVAIDQRSNELFGLEFPLKYELENRLRFYLDATFREHKLRTYKDQIAPKMSAYDIPKVIDAFKRDNCRQRNLDKELTQLLKQ